MAHPKQWTLEDPGYSRSPQICSDSEGRYWVAWISWMDNSECVKVSFKNPGEEWSKTIQCSESRPFVAGLAITPMNDGVLVAWTDGPDSLKDGLKLVPVSTKGPGECSLIDPQKNNPAHPALDSFKDRFVLGWSRSSGSGRMIVGYLGQDTRTVSPLLDVSDGTSLNTRPAVVCHEAGALMVWQALTSGLVGILARHVNGEGNLGRLIGVSQQNPGISALPDAVRAGSSGAWVAWQSDFDYADGPGLVRWIELAHISKGGELRYTKEPMPGVNRRGEGEDQGFEAPSLATLESGRLAMIGRGSQSVQRQDFGAGGWSERVQIDEPGWACRGQKFVCSPARGGLLVAGRERGDVVVRLLDTGWPELGGSGEELLVSPPGGDVQETILPTRYPHIVAGHRVLFGDTHQHTSVSDGTGTWEETYCRAHYRYGDDLAAVSDHESFLGKRTPPGEWEMACKAADDAYIQGKFVTLHAFEWTGLMHPGPGHKVVYLLPGGGPVLSRDDAASRTSKGLISECRKIGALVFPHHVGWTGADMDAHHPEVQTCFEMVSCHGAYERKDVGPIGTRGDDKEGQFVADALDQGHRFGFVGGSDGHGLDWHHGICRKRDSHRTGLTAVFAKKTSREGVIEALRRRRCYATSGAKIGLWFEIDGRPMGEELFCSESLPFRVVVSGTEEVESIKLVTNRGQETEIDVSGTEIDFRGTVAPPTADGWCYYYIRVVQKDGEVAWSSPIWLDAPDTA